MNPLALLKLIPQRWIILGLTHAVFLVIGLALANSWATKRVAEAIAERDARDQAAMAGALIEQQRSWKVEAERLQRAHAQADADALTAFESRMKRMDANYAKSQTDLSTALAAADIAQTANMNLRTKTDALEHDNAQLSQIIQANPPSAGCVLPGSVRFVLDKARDQGSPGDPSGPGAPQTGGAAGASEAPASTEPLTCQQLAVGDLQAVRRYNEVAGQLWILLDWIEATLRDMK